MSDLTIQSLAREIKRGGYPVDKFLEIGIQEFGEARILHALVLVLSQNNSKIISEGPILKSSCLNHYWNDVMEVSLVYQVPDDRA